MTPGTPAEAESLRRLVDEYRVRCLWFLREGYYPETTTEASRVLDAIERYGDADAFRRVGAVKRWLSASTSETSAGSSRATE